MKIGDQVSVATRHDRFQQHISVCAAYVIARDRSDAIMFNARLVGFPTTSLAFYDTDEGVTWCHGHDGPAVDALKVAQALR